LNSPCCCDLDIDYTAVHAAECGVSSVAQTPSLHFYAPQTKGPRAGSMPALHSGTYTLYSPPLGWPDELRPRVHARVQEPSRGRARDASDAEPKWLSVQEKAAATNEVSVANLSLEWLRASAPYLDTYGDKSPRFKQWLRLAGAYLDTFGDKSRRLRLELLHEFDATSATEQQFLVEALVEKASGSRSPYSIDDAVEFLASVDAEVLQRVFIRGLIRHEANADFWDIVAGGIARSAANTTNKLFLLALILQSKSQATRETAVAALAKMAHCGVSEAVSALVRVAQDERDPEVSKEAKLALEDLS